MLHLSHAKLSIDTIYVNDKNLGMENSSQPKQERLQAPTKPTLADRFEKLATDLNRLVDRKRKLGKGPMLNALASWFLEQPTEDQVRILNEGIRLYEAMPGEEYRGKKAKTEVDLADSRAVTGSILPERNSAGNPKRKK